MKQEILLLVEVANLLKNDGWSIRCSEGRLPNCAGPPVSCMLYVHILDLSEFPMSVSLSLT